MFDSRIGERAVFSGSAGFGVSSADERKALRGQRIEECLMTPVAAPGTLQVQELSCFYNKTLACVDQLRHPVRFPDLDRCAEASTVSTEGPAEASSVGSVNPRYYDIAAQMGRSIDSRGREVPLDREQLSILAASLSTYDLSTLKNLQQEGLRIRLYDTENPPAGGYPGGASSWESSTLGTYRGNEKLISLRQKDFRGGLTGDVQDVVHHEMGHAVDDMLYADTANGREMATEHDPYMKQLYQNYLERTDSNQGYQWSKYARTNVKEYFADGVEFYMGSPEKREALRQKDPALYAQVENMLGRASGRGAAPVRNWNATPYHFDHPIPWNTGPYRSDYPAAMNNGPYWGPRVNASTWPDNQYQALAQYIMLCRLQWMMALMMSQSMGIPRF